jgi:hypothetical protein
MLPRQDDLSGFSPGGQVPVFRTVASEKLLQSHGLADQLLLAFPDLTLIGGRRMRVPVEDAGVKRLAVFLRQLDLEVAELFAKAEQADATPLQDSLSIPPEVARRQARKAKLAQARAAIEARAYARAMAEQAAREPERPGPPPRSRSTSPTPTAPS